MIIIFFILNVTIFLVISLAMSMFDNHLKNISNSIDIFLDPKAYKPKSKMQFISSLLDKYKKYENELAMGKGIDVLIDDCFYDQKVGIFNIFTIYTIAHQGKQLLWASIGLMVVFEEVTIGLGGSMIHSVLIILSGGLGLFLIFSQFYKDIDLEKQRLFVKVKNYLNHTYPYLKSRQKEQEEQKEVFLLKSKISELEGEIEKFEQTNQQGLKENEMDFIRDEIEPIEDEADLIEEDIIKLIEYFV